MERSLVWHNFVNYAKGEYKKKMNILFEHIITDEDANIVVDTVAVHCQENNNTYI